MKGPINVLLKKGDYYYVTQKWKYWQLCYVPAVWTAYHAVSYTHLQDSIEKKFVNYNGKLAVCDDYDLAQIPYFTGYVGEYLSLIHI